MDLVLIALAVGAGVDHRRVSLLAVSLFLPWVVLGMIAMVVWAGARQGGNRAALFCDGVASELRSGSSLRQALSGSATAVGLPSVAAEVDSGDLTDLGVVTAAEFPAIAAELAITVESAARTGVSAADLFDEVGTLAIAHEEIRREIRVASAPARAAAGIFAGVPLVYLGWRWASGDLAAMFANSQQRSIAFGGLALFVVGLLGVGLVMWRAR